MKAKQFIMRSGGRALKLESPQIWGIVNITSDSFYEGSRKNEHKSAFAEAEKHILEGAKVVDLGAMSSRPGAWISQPQEELEKLVPLVERLKDEYPDCWISIDTLHSEVADRCLTAGADIINDISGAYYDKKMLSVVARHNVPIVLMHMRGKPADMQSHTHYDDMIRVLMLYFKERIEACSHAGIHDIIIDPGFGFSKNIAQNMHVLSKIETFKVYDLPVLIGISRKSTIYKTLNTSPSEALNGTTAMHMIALLNGVDILRVHDVKEAIEALKLFNLYKLSC